MEYLTKYYLKGLTIENPENFNENIFYVSGKDIIGRKFSGKFDKSQFKEGLLEVKIIGISYNVDWIWILPFKGEFLGENKIIPVNKSQIYEEKNY